MAIYYVASLGRYELVEAQNEQEAERLMAPLLPGPVRIVREADAGEIRLCDVHQQNVAAE